MTKKKTAKKSEKRQTTAPAALSPSSAESMQAHRRRDRKSKEVRSRSPSRKIRKNSDKSNVSSSPFSLTPNAIELIVSGVDILRRKDESLETPSKAEAISTEKTSQTELILRLRLDVPSSESSGASTEKTEQTMGNQEHEDQAALFGTLGDGKSSIRAMLLNPDGIWSRRLSRGKMAAGEKEGTGDWIVKVHGYATTEKFWHKTYRIFPIVCLTSISILQTCPNNGKKKSSKSLLGKPLFWNVVSGKSGPFPAGTGFKAQAGTIGTFLKERSPFLTNEELAGSSRMVDEKVETLKNSNDEEPLSRDQNFKKVQECLSQHSAMLTLQQSSLSPPSSAKRNSEGDNLSSPSSPTAPVNNDSSRSSSSPQPPASPLKSSRPGQHAWELYDGALREFRISQMDRQKASLGTNAGRESAERAQMVVDRHNSAMELALKEEGPLSIELLEKWHKELLSGLHPEAGIIRTRKVRCGHTVFCPPKRIRKELELFCAGLKSLELRLDMTNNALHVVLFAAVAIFGIIDIHPFIDGNGRLSRIVANYALNKRLPFAINLFATPAQRNEYVVALERTRHVLSLNCAYGDVSRDDLVQVLKTTGVFGSMVQLLMDRVARAATALTASWEEKSCLAAEAAEAKAARRVRERASRGTCMICLDEKPNIATLCCGNAIHLNCCAEWLSGNNKCPICRHEMPSISRRVVRALEEPEGRWEGEDENDLSDLIDRRRPEVFSREYHNFVDRFWDEIRNSRDRSNRAIRQPQDLLLRINRFQPDEDDYEDEFQTMSTFERDEDDYEDEFHTTTTTSEDDDEDVGEPVQPQIPAFTRRNRPQANREDELSEDEEDEIGDTTTTFEEESSSSDVPDQTTTFTDSDGNLIQERRQGRPMHVNCAAHRCRNRPAVDCINSCCGRCCILIGNYHCPRHNS